MARTITVIGPSGLATPTLDLVNDADAVTQTVTLTEATNAKGRYNGTLSAPLGIYTGVLRTDGTPVGTFGYCRVMGVDPENAKAIDSSGVPDGIKLNQAITRSNLNSADTLQESVAED